MNVNVNIGEPTIAEQNGVIRITRKGRVKFAFGEDGEPFDVDVMGVWNEWVQVSRSIEGIDGKIPNDKIVAFDETKRAFVQAKVQDAYKGRQEPIPVLSHIEAVEFLNLIWNEVERLRPFFEPKLPGLLASPASSELRFSQ